MMRQTTNHDNSGHFLAMTQPTFCKSTNIPGRYEYLLVANPGNEVNAMLIDEKELFYNKYKQQYIGKNKPHITVATFWAMEHMENTISRWMQRICAMQEAFTVMLNNFSGFPPHAIFVRVQQPKPFIQLANQLRVVENFIAEYGMPPARLTKTPHINIAANLSPDVYTKAMFEYSQKDFFSTFQVNELILLKRKSRLDGCEKINVFGLAAPSA